jgi:RND family efflux transporter MFP subunit
MTTRLLAFALCAALHHLAAAQTLPLTPAQKANLGIVTQRATAAANSDAVAVSLPARVVLPPSAVAVVAAGGAGLVTRVWVQAGDTVKRGAALVSVSMPGLADAQAATTQARLRHQLAAANATRDQALFAEGLIAEARLRATQSEAATARALLAAAQAQQALLGSGTVRGATLTLTSPMAGSVMTLAVEPGARVDAGTALAKVVDTAQVGLEISLTSAQAASVAVGQKIRLADGRAGRIRALLPQLDAAQSVTARATLDKAARGVALRPGQSVQVSVLPADATASTNQAAMNTVVIPAPAVVWQARRAYVFVQSTQGFTPTPVSVVRQDAARAEVSGIAVGTEVAVKGLVALKAQWLGGE